MPEQMCGTPSRPPAGVSTSPTPTVAGPTQSRSVVQIAPGGSSPLAFTIPGGPLNLPGMTAEQGTPLNNPMSLGPVQLGVSQLPGQLTQAQQAMAAQQFNPAILTKPGLLASPAGIPLNNPMSLGSLQLGVSQMPGQLTQGQLAETDHAYLANTGSVHLWTVTARQPPPYRQTSGICAPNDNHCEKVCGLEIGPCLSLLMAEMNRYFIAHPRAARLIGGLPLSGIHRPDTWDIEQLAWEKTAFLYDSEELQCGLQCRDTASVHRFCSYTHGINYMFYGRLCRWGKVGTTLMFSQIDAYRTLYSTRKFIEEGVVDPFGIKLRKFWAAMGYLGFTSAFDAHSFCSALIREVGELESEGDLRDDELVVAAGGDVSRYYAMLTLVDCFDSARVDCDPCPLPYRGVLDSYFIDKNDDTHVFFINCSTGESHAVFASGRDGKTRKSLMNRETNYARLVR